MVSIFFATQGHFVVLIFSFRRKRASSYSGVQGRLCLFGQVNISIYGLFKINKKFRIHITIYSDRTPKFIEQEFYWLSSKFLNLRCQKPKRSFKNVFSDLTKAYVTRLVHHDFTIFQDILCCFACSFTLIINQIALNTIYIPMIPKTYITLQKKFRSTSL